MAMSVERRNEIAYLLFRWKYGREPIKLVDLQREIGNACKVTKVSRKEVEEFVREFLISFIEPNPRFVVDGVEDSNVDL